MKLRRAGIAACAVLALVLTAAGPVEAASTTKKPKAPASHVTGIWVGQIVRHTNHWDYVGQSCPTGSPCGSATVRYRINPTTAQARAALAGFTGGPGGVTGQLRPPNDRGHQGMLLATGIATANGAPPAPGTPGRAGTPGQPTDGTPGQNSTPTS